MIYLKYLWRLIINNPVKLIALSIAIVGFTFAGKIPDNISEHNVINTFRFNSVEGKKWVYVTLDNGSFDVFDYDTEQPIIGHKLIHHEFNIVNALLWIMSGIIIFFIIMLTFMDDNDLNWNGSDIWVKVKLTKVKCHLQDSKYYYVLDNKLLAESQDMINYYTIHSLVENYIKNKNLYPTFHTIEELRDKKIDRIGC